MPRNRSRYQQLDQVRIAAVGQAQVQVADDGDRHEQVLGQHQRGEQHHRPVGAADHRDRGGFAVGHAQRDGDGEGGHGAQLGEQRQDHALERPRHHEARRRAARRCP